MPKVDSPRKTKSKSVIQLENISVCYEISIEPIVSFKEYAIQFMRGRIKTRKFLALSNVSLEVYRGEILGIIGKNGAGKSTLLKVISRILPPTTGRIRVIGDVSPLLELGAGFHPELTGRENIFLNGTLLGHTRRDIEDHLEDVINFAEIGEFIDAPLRTYSSGMVTRLGFSVATAWKPDILIIDETLTVGDDMFQQKCKARITDFRQKGSTILLVTHDVGTIAAICTRALWLDKGEIQTMGEARDAVDAYLKN
jgi:ABC-2 type transport system ATP-binding protein/lipopolysaccharide transport system ATP-binding protein